MKELKNEYEFLENPVLQIVYKQEYNIDAKLKKWIMFHTSAVPECVGFIKRVQNCVGNSALLPSSSLSKVFNKINPNDCIFFSKSKCKIKHKGILKRQDCEK